MTALVWLLPLALVLSLSGLFAFFWALKSGQFEDTTGDAERILMDVEDKPIMDKFAESEKL